MDKLSGVPFYQTTITSVETAFRQSKSYTQYVQNLSVIFKQQVTPTNLTSNTIQEPSPLNSMALLKVIRSIAITASNSLDEIREEPSPKRQKIEPTESAIPKPFLAAACSELLYTTYRDKGNIEDTMANPFSTVKSEIYSWINTGKISSSANWHVIWYYASQYEINALETYCQKTLEELWNNKSTPQLFFSQVFDRKTIVNQAEVRFFPYSTNLTLWMTPKLEQYFVDNPKADHLQILSYLIEREICPLQETKIDSPLLKQCANLMRAVVAGNLLFKGNASEIALSIYKPQDPLTKNLLIDLFAMPFQNVTFCPYRDNLLEYKEHFRAPQLACKGYVFYPNYRKRVFDVEEINHLIEFLTFNKTIRHLKLSGFQMTVKEFAKLTQFVGGPLGQSLLSFEIRSGDIVGSLVNLTSQEQGHIKTFLAQNQNLNKFTFVKSNLDEFLYELMTDGLKSNRSIIDLALEAPARQNSQGELGYFSNTSFCHVSEFLQNTQQMISIQVKGEIPKDTNSSHFLKALSKQNKLKKLRLENLTFLVNTTEVFSAISHFPDLQYVEFFNTDLSKNLSQFLENLCSHSSIRFLNLGFNNINDEMVDQISKLITLNKSLIHFEMEGNSFNESSFKKIETALAHNKTLQCIRVEDPRISSEQLNKDPRFEWKKYVDKQISPKD